MNNGDFFNRASSYNICFMIIFFFYQHVMISIDFWYKWDLNLRSLRVLGVFYLNLKLSKCFI